jgi:hypothetical protein
VYGFSSLFGTGAAGPIVVAVLLIAALVWLSIARVRQAAHGAAAAPGGTHPEPAR